MSCPDIFRPKSMIFISTKAASALKQLSDCWHFAFQTVQLKFSKLKMTSINCNKTDAEAESVMGDFSMLRERAIIWDVPEALEEDEEGSMEIFVKAADIRAALKSGRKDDQVAFYILKDRPKLFYVHIYNGSKDRNLRTSIDIIKVENHEEVRTSAYASNIPNAICDSAEIKKAVKCAGMKKGVKIKLTAQKRGIKFESQVSPKTEYVFGDYDITCEDIYSGVFDVKNCINLVARCCSMGGPSSVIQIYCEKGKPVKFAIDCQILGIFYLYITCNR